MKKLFLGILFLSSGFLQAQDPQAFSLSDAIAYAEKESNSLKNAEINLAYAKEQVRDYTSIGLPHLSAGIDYKYNIQIPVSVVPANTFNPMAPDDEYVKLKFGVNHNLAFNATLSTLVFDGSYFVGLKAAKGLVELNMRQKDLAEHDIKYGVKSAYLTVLMMQENKEVIERNITNLEKLLQETKAFYKNGMVEQLDVDRLELSKSNLLAELDIVERQTDLAQNALKFQMNYPLDKPITLTDSLSALLQEISLEDLSGSVSLDNRQELKVLRQSEYLNDLNVRRYQMQYVPNMTAFLTHQQSLQRNDLFKTGIPFVPATILGLSLKVPIFDGFGTDAKIKMARLDKERISLQIKELERGITLEVMNARVNVQNAQERLKNQESNLALAEKILATTKTKYREGVGSSFEITQAEQELYRTQAAYMNALYDLLMAKNSLDKALGN